MASTQQIFPRFFPNLAFQKLIVTIAFPAMLTNIATALFGLADIWMIGRMGNPNMQGGVEIGARLLTTLCVIFNFLRSGTTALTAQAAGQKTTPETPPQSLTETPWQEDELGHPCRKTPNYQTERTLVRAVALAISIGAFLLILKPVLLSCGLYLLDASGAVATQAQYYVARRYWVIPLILTNSVLSAWLIGIRRMRAVLIMEISSNFLHIALDWIGVIILGQGVRAVANASVISEIFSTAFLLVMISRHIAFSQLPSLFKQTSTWHKQTILDLFRLNRDLFIRTILLMSAITLFTRMSVQQGIVILAANAILNQLFTLSVLILDGYESAAQILCGEAVGMNDKGYFFKITQNLMIQSLSVALVMALFYTFRSPFLMQTFTTDHRVIDIATKNAFWLSLLPILGVSSFVMDGVFVGAGWSRAMMFSMAGASFLFTLSLTVMHGFGNYGLWLAYSLFYLFRSGLQLGLLPFLAKRQFT
ncbi:MAG: MATE family efflux transporter [Zymomonas mobilis subsp. pomaceae]|uniref:MATE efflux family protein n=1 Tax=Zymomonas mobilis subsp. pomaceae (strain ATCC 29192 / DSM 22645 / JCM 10191 / CCUG 17912 / NBRC 13757 / NCIMB 11200 / NRRL B-4491 / Barker I) TaxID=579138 RepID=F8ESS5_ZYMMT|nr:MATE family efflux transporter [Zymomonas mobilis]AEI37850.1 MATE efflux family protein [Zymomonas mobilis subsp. pomaceae ATCC 29192]MDX5949217.1 MATE family efflux transporter [Zymomonas mobilis subsp. pomaceae]GEB89554.1 MATE family efflux transporter [Zymomonas mobilis subsp. pomaceae]